MCLYWIRKYAKNIEPKAPPMHVLTLSKWASFIASSREKTEFMSITLVTKKTRQIVGFDLAYDKSKNRTQKLTARSKQNTTIPMPILAIKKCLIAENTFIFTISLTPLQSKASILTSANTLLHFNANPNAFFAY